MDWVVPELLPITKRPRLVMEEEGLHHAMAVPVVVHCLEYLLSFRLRLVQTQPCRLRRLIVHSVSALSISAFSLIESYWISKVGKWWAG